MSELPPGFVLDQPAAQGLPPDFVLDAPKEGGGIINAAVNSPGAMVDTAKSMGQTIADTLNPFSDARHAKYAKMASSSFADSVGQQLGDLADVGSGAVNAATIVPSVLATPLVKVGGAAFDAISPSFTPEERQRAEAAGLKINSGEDAMRLALAGARPAGVGPSGPMTKAGPAPSVSDLKDAYKAVRESPAVKTATVPSSDIATAQSAITNDLMRAGYRPTTASAPGTFAELENLKPPAGAPSVQMDDLLAARRAFGRYAGQTLEGKPTPDASAATHAMRSLDKLIEQHVPQMAEANANYAAAKRAESFDLRGAKAVNNADAANSGMNLENQLRSQVRQILNNPKLQRGYNAETLDALKQFNKGSRSANALRAVGNILGGGGGWATVANSAIGGTLGGPAGAFAQPAIGMALKSAGNARAAKEFDRLSDMIRAASPLARNAAPLPVSTPNPLLSGLPISQIPMNLGLRPMLGVVPSAADQKRKDARR